MPLDPISTQSGPEEWVSDYQAIRQGAAIGGLDRRGAIGMTGSDRASYLQGLLTNDIVALEAGSGCYSAWLTPQGRMLTDMHLFESGDMMLLDVPESEVRPTLDRLDQFLFGEDVQVMDLTTALSPVWIHGPNAPALVEAVVSGLHDVSTWEEHANRRAEFDGSPVVVARVSQVGVTGLVIYAELAKEQALTAALVRMGGVIAAPQALEAARVEAGYPLFGSDMNEDIIPLEAGIESRAISFSKGCYVGQEIIIRVTHRGKGRVAKKLASLEVRDGVPQVGSAIVSGDREIGRITSAAEIPTRGPMALGYLHRDFLAEGTAVEIVSSGQRLPAAVVNPGSRPGA